MAHSVTESALVLECRVGMQLLWLYKCRNYEHDSTTTRIQYDSDDILWLLNISIENEPFSWMIYDDLPIKMVIFLFATLNNRSVSCEVGTYQQPSTRTLVFLEDISVSAEFSSYTLGCIPAGKWLHYMSYIYIITNGLSLVIYVLYIYNGS